jgi:hypothetical protein
MNKTLIIPGVAVALAAVAAAVALGSAGSREPAALEPPAKEPAPAVAASAEPTASCTAPGAHAAHPAASPLPRDEVEKVAEFVAAHLASHPGALPGVDDIEAATGVVIGDRVEQFKQEVGAHLAATHPDRLARFERENRCSQYEACSLEGDLAAAKTETLEMYEREKGQDGKTFSDLQLSPFDAETLAGERTSSTALAGKPTVLALVAVHCGHSLDSLPILQELQLAHASRGLQVVAVYVNSGDASYLRSWLPLNFFEKPRFAVWAADGLSLGDVVDSHLVPTYLFVDARGKIQRKLVGFKQRAEIEQGIDELLAAR